MLKAIFNVMLYKNKELTEEGKMIKPNNKVDIIEIAQNYVKVHIINDYYISLEQFKNAFEEV